MFKNYYRCKVCKGAAIWMDRCKKKVIDKETLRETYPHVPEAVIVNPHRTHARIGYLELDEQMDNGSKLGEHLRGIFGKDFVIYDHYCDDKKTYIIAVDPKFDKVKPAGEIPRIEWR